MRLNYFSFSKKIVILSLKYYVPYLHSSTLILFIAGEFAKLRAFRVFGLYASSRLTHLRALIFTRLNYEINFSKLIMSVEVSIIIVAIIIIIIISLFRFGLKNTTKLKR